MSLLSPQSLPFDFDEWKKKPFWQRVKMLCQAWAIQGYGAPAGVYAVYIIKVAFYIWMWAFFCSFSNGLGGLENIEAWWARPEALLKAVMWSMLFEGLGLGSGSGPLTARYNPPVGGFLYFLRPKTIKLPLFPQIPFVGRDSRGILDIAMYAAHIGLLIRALTAPEVTPELILPTIILLPVMTLFDKTMFLVSRGEHYWIAMFCFLFPVTEALSGAKMVWFAVWFWAATSKLNKHFPSVIGVMISNSGVLKFQWLRKALYRNYPEDLRHSKLAAALAHMGTVAEYTFPFVLMFSDGGMTTTLALLLMLGFHSFITSNVPMAVPIEWNFIMVYGGFVLFGQYPTLGPGSLSSIELIAAIAIMVGLLPVLGNLFPRFISFLISMRYYAGNWAYSIWLFRDNANEKLDDHIVKTSKTLMRQLSLFYDEKTSEALLSRVIAFRSMHLHGRVLQEIVPQAVDDIEKYTWRDGELIAGLVLGWNFGDGHLHDEQMLGAIQKRCNYKSGELRCIFVESQPFWQPRLDWRVVDAADGQILAGSSSVIDLLEKHPWPLDKVSD